MRAAFTLSQKPVPCTTTFLFLRAPRRFVGEVSNLRPIGNRPVAGIFWAQGETPASFCGLPLCGAGCQTAADCQSGSCSADNPVCSPVSSGSLRLAIRRFLPQETFPPGIVCRSCERAWVLAQDGHVQNRRVAVSFRGAGAGTAWTNAVPPDEHSMMSSVSAQAAQHMQCMEVW